MSAVVLRETNFYRSKKDHPRQVQRCLLPFFARRNDRLGCRKLLTKLSEKTLGAAAGLTFQ
ncbi:hypothetical protein E2C01_053798 [Portunus trituberculatus]|uniref:Uncharacterized protein n=1 Tax=Portunus trituberculatus TaxID=210409 RepID=A0A5B7GHP6_PORTR|nr:hypothetical protein [Portunus trituberculatus]